MAHGLDHPSNFFVLRVFVVAVAARSSLWRIWALALALRISPFSLTLIVIVRSHWREGEHVQRSDFKVAFASKPVERQTPI